MPITKGEKIARKLEKSLLKISNAIEVTCKTGGTRCAGAFDPLSNEFDPKRDRTYHASNPSSPVCVRGLIGQTTTIKTIQGFHFPNLKDAELDYLGIGELGSNEAVLLTMRNQVVDGIVEYKNPADLRAYRVKEGFPRTIVLSNVKIFHYCVSVLK